VRILDVVWTAEAWNRICTRILSDFCYVSSLRFSMSNATFTAGRSKFTARRLVLWKDTRNDVVLSDQFTECVLPFDPESAVSVLAIRKYEDYKHGTAIVMLIYDILC
jgi:hypothetical protein